MLFKAFLAAAIVPVSINPIKSKRKPLILYSEAHHFKESTIYLDIIGASVLTSLEQPEPSV